MRLTENEFVLAMAIVVGVLCGASCGSENSDSTTRTQGDLQALGSDLLFTMVHEGHAGLTEEHDEFLDELREVRERLTNEHKEVLDEFYEERLAPMGLTQPGFLHRLYYTPTDPMITSIANHPQLIEVEEALHGALGVAFDEELATRPKLAFVTAALIVCVTAIVVPAAVHVVNTISAESPTDFCRSCSAQHADDCVAQGKSVRTCCEVDGDSNADGGGGFSLSDVFFSTHNSNNTQHHCTSICVDSREAGSVCDHSQ